MLMDFGLAKVSGATRLTLAGTTMGTMAYMSPELVHGRQADGRSDIWALGAVLYEMVSGEAPFGGDYEAALVYGILNDDPPPLASLGGGIPAGLDGIMAKALEKDPARRYQDAEELVADLDTLARDSEAMPRGKSRSPEGPEAPLAAVAPMAEGSGGLVARGAGCARGNADDPLPANRSGSEEIFSRRDGLPRSCDFG